MIPWRIQVSSGCVGTWNIQFYHSTGSDDSDITGVLELADFAIVRLEHTVCECKSPDESLHNEARSKEQPGIHPAVDGRESRIILNI